MAAKQTLLVEGINDLHVFCNLFEKHSIPQDFQVKNKEGISKLIDELDVELLASDLKTLGIVVDADANLSARWMSLTNRLSKSGYQNLPSEPDREGTIITQSGLPKVGVWVMPDNRLDGMLEDFIAYLIPQEDRLWEYARQSVDSITPEKCLFRNHFAKAYIHTWLAWQKEPGMPMGSAIKMRYLDSDALQARIFVSWIRQLFSN